MRKVPATRIEPCSFCRDTFRAEELVPIETVPGYETRKRGWSCMQCRDRQTP